MALNQHTRLSEKVLHLTIGASLCRYFSRAISTDYNVLTCMYSNCDSHHRQPGTTLSQLHACYFQWGFYWGVGVGGGSRWMKAIHRVEAFQGQ